MRPAPSRSARGVRDSTLVHATTSRHRGGRDRASRSHGHKSLCHVVSRAVLAPPRDPTLPAPANNAAGTRAGGIPRQRERRAAAHGIPRRGAPPATGAAARAACVAADTRGRRQGGGPPQARLCAHPPPLWATAWRGRRRAYSGPTTSMTTRPTKAGGRHRVTSILKEILHYVDVLDVSRYEKNLRDRDARRRRGTELSVVGLLSSPC